MNPFPFLFCVFKSIGLFGHFWLFATLDEFSPDLQVVLVFVIFTERKMSFVNNDKSEGITRHALSAWAFNHVISFIYKMNSHFIVLCFERDPDHIFMVQNLMRFL